MQRDDKLMADHLAEERKKELLELSKKCTRCGAENKKKNNYCTICGKKFDEKKPLTAISD